MLIANSPVVMTAPPGGHHSAPQPPERSMPARCMGDNHGPPAVLHEAFRDRVTVEVDTSPRSLLSWKLTTEQADGGKPGEATPTDLFTIRVAREWRSQPVA